MFNLDATDQPSFPTGERGIDLLASPTHGVVVAREHQPIYEAGTDDADAGRNGDAPFGSPVLAELPELAALLQTLADADGLLVRAAVQLAALLGTDDVEATTGVSLEHWLAITVRQTRLDRRLLQRLARLMHRFPALHVAADAGHVSFAQLRSLTLALREAPTAIDRPLDDWLGAAVGELTDADPDAIVEQVRQAIAELAPQVQTADEQLAHASRHLYLQPRLDGTGGRIHGELDAAGLALLDDATAPRADQLHGDIGAARADNLLAWLTHACPTGSAAAGGEGSSAPPELSDTAGGPEGPGMPRLLLRMSLDSLLDAQRTPAQLLTRLIGGKLWLSADAARRLIDERGAELRSVAIDDTGSVVGVGRGSRIAPGWLAEATLAVHDTCTGPLCDRPARDAQIDHATPWWPTGADQPLGRTDVDELGPLCATTNRAKEAAGWRATQTGDGRRTWHHRRSGLTITTVPATWRPRNHRARGADPPADGSDPPTPGSGPLAAGGDPPVVDGVSPDGHAVGEPPFSTDPDILF